MLKLLEKPKNDLQIHYKNRYAAFSISHRLQTYLTDNMAIVCIGTDKCIFDCLGPLIGTMLTKNNICIDVYGTLENPVHGMNMVEQAREINRKNYKTILVIDACLSNRKEQGIIEVREQPLTPGKGIGKSLPEIGDISIIGVMDTSDKDFNDLIQDTRLSMVYAMAEVITAGILNAVSCRNNIFEEVAYD
jgi:putative sporulation protein YyaC